MKADCDFDIFGASGVVNNAQLADCNGKRSWLLFVVWIHVSKTIPVTFMIFKRKS